MALLPGAGLLSLGGIILIAGFLWKIWRNDLRHMSKALDRIEHKLDDHIKDHAKGSFRE